MSAQDAFQIGLRPWLQVLLPGKEAQVLALEGSPVLRARIELLARKSTEGDLTEDERAEYEGYVRANKFAAVLRRQAMSMAGK